MEANNIVKICLILSYGFFSIFLVGLSFYLTCSYTGCYYYQTPQMCICPTHLTIPLAFVSFVMAAIPPLIRRKDFASSLGFGFAAVFALLIASIIATNIRPQCCPLLMIADIGIYTTFITSIGSLYFNWKKEKRRVWV